MNSRERRRCERRERRAARRCRRLMWKRRGENALRVALIALFAVFLYFGLTLITNVTGRILDILYPCPPQADNVEEWQPVWKGRVADLPADTCLGTVTTYSTQGVWRKPITVGVASEADERETERIEFAGWYDIEATADGFEYRAFRADGTFCDSGSLTEAKFYAAIASGDFDLTDGTVDVAAIADAALSKTLTRNHPHFCVPYPHPLCLKCSPKERNQ